MAGRKCAKHQSRTQARDALGRFSRSPASSIPRRPISSSSPAGHASIAAARTPSSTTKGEIHIKEEAHCDEDTPDVPPGFEGSATTKKKGKEKKVSCVRKAELMKAEIMKAELKACYVFNKVQVTFSFTEESDDEDEEVLKANQIRELAERLRRALRWNYKKYSK